MRRRSPVPVSGRSPGSQEGLSKQDPDRRPDEGRCPEALENAGFRPQFIPHSMRGRNDEDECNVHVSTPSGKGGNPELYLLSHERVDQGGEK